MFENLGFRVFCLSSTRSRNRISCDADGAFIGSVPLLRRSKPHQGSNEHWVVRSEADLNEKLTQLYGLPIDVATKIGGMQTIARALNGGNLVLAKIATVAISRSTEPTRV